MELLTGISYVNDSLYHKYACRDNYVCNARDDHRITILFTDTDILTVLDQKSCHGYE